MKFFARNRYNQIKEAGEGLYERNHMGLTVRSSHLNTLRNTFDNIFLKGIYDFEANTERPYIIDGGANIGLATLYWKSKYPYSKIVAFEPSREVHKMLIANLEENEIEGVDVYQKALYDKETVLNFTSNEALSGSLVLEKDLDEVYQVETTLLSRFITKEVALLKLDIEGAELEVLKEIQPKLDRVERIFLEYHAFESKPQQLSILLGTLEDAGFRYHLTSEYALDSPFLGFRKSLGQDLQVNIWAIRC